MRTKYIIGNWKMNTTVGEATVLARSIARKAHEWDGIEVVLAPPALWLTHLKEELHIKPANLTLGAQNASWKQFGPLTGEISPAMLKPLVDYCIVGHSERRTQFHETPELVADKVIALLEEGIRPIVCIGELTQSPSDGLDKEMKRQLHAVLKIVDKKDATKLVFAYEPLWAIGTGHPATPEIADSVITAIRNEIALYYDQLVADKISVLYGGSVTSRNIRSFCKITTVDGALVGGASLLAREFNKICEFANGVY